MILVVDNLLTEKGVTELLDSAFASGFGTWNPAQPGMVKGPVYDGMAFHAKHAIPHNAISKALGRPICPNLSFVRAATEKSSRRVIHSDRNDGDYTAIIYLSDHKKPSGTAFYRHKPTGRIEMPSFEEMQKDGDLAQMCNDMSESDEETWEETHRVLGMKGTAVIFSSPLFHGRYPEHGIGDTVDNSRKIWVCHFL